MSNLSNSELSKLLEDTFQSIKSILESIEMLHNRIINLEKQVYNNTPESLNAESPEIKEKLKKALLDE